MYAHYFSNLDTLDFDSKYHFLHHLYLWNGDANAKKLLNEMAGKFLDPKRLEQYLRDIYTRPSHTHVKNAPNLRRPVLARHPHIRPINSLLIEVLYAKTVFGYDAKALASKLTPDSAIIDSFVKLDREQRDIAVLSTYAVNSLYVADRFYFGEEKLSPVTMLSFASSLDLSNPDEQTLYFYYITHCIIGESLFYSRAIPEQYKATYIDALSKLDTILMTDAYTELHMDIKFEVLVCAKMCGVHLRSAAKIYEEAMQSVSPQGDYIVDTVNNQAQQNYANLSSSEHRNVLFLMSCTDFSPAPPLHVG